MYSFILLVASAGAAPIVLDGRAAHHTFDGIGALSAGASSRLLYDYPEPYRTDILDLLFKPQHGAALQILKVEIGGDAQSTDGSEASHMHTREDLSCGRGYESWLISEAKKRNPSIITYGLSWATPRWVGDGTGNGTSFHSPDNWLYQTRWLECMKNVTGANIDWMGTWNEKPPGPTDYVKGLRASFDAAGFSNTQISVYDGDWSTGDVVKEAQDDPVFAASFASIGRHYPCVMPFPAVESSINKKYWSSEDSSSSNDWEGASCWARLLNRNYVYNNMTATIAWSLIWSVPPGLPCQGAGLMTAIEPWSGHYSGGDGGGPPSTVPSLNGPLWTTAHTTQFTSPGWRYLLTGNGSGLLAGSGGSYVTLVPPADLSAFTIVIEKVVGPCKCNANATPVPMDGVVDFLLGGGLPGPGTLVQVWRTNASSQFVRDVDTSVGSNGILSVFVAADSVVTLSTVSGAARGTPPSPPPPPAPFPLPYADDFSRYAEDATPLRYWADQTGSFAARGGAMVQVVETDPGPNRWVNEDLDPITILGDASLATDVVVNVGAKFAPAANSSGTGSGTALGFTYVQTCCRIFNYTGLRTRPPQGYCLLLNSTGGWLARAGSNSLGEGQLPLPFSPGEPHYLTLEVKGSQVVAWVSDGASPGEPLLNVSDVTFPLPGPVALGSGFHTASFYNFSLSSA